MLIKVVFPYGNQYGWGIGHYIKKKLICNIFAEAGAFTVMMRLADTQYEAIYDSLKKYTQEHIDNNYPCGDGGWIHYPVMCRSVTNLSDGRRKIASANFFSIRHVNAQEWRLK